MQTRTLLLVAATALSLTACDAAVEQLTEEAVERAAEAGGAGDTEIDLDDGGISVETDEGSFEVGADGELPDGFPPDIPLPDGYTVVSSSTFTNDDGEAIQVAMEVTGLDVVTYIEEEVIPGLEDAGYEIVSQSTTSAGEGNVSNVTGETGEQRVQVTATGSADGEAFVTIGVLPAS